MSLLEKIESNRSTKVTVCNDPMNGCPGDFAEDYDRLFWGLVNEARAAGHSEKEISEASERGTASGHKELDATFKEGYKALVERNRANAEASSEERTRHIQETKCEEYTSQCITKGDVLTCAERLGCKTCPFIEYEKGGN